ncbi:MAG: CoA transferase [Dehalococcoidales bacterium]|nr:MAG: CoA transferase [Dehalococcoidales bacterium]
MAKKMLEGIKVADFAGVIAGAYTTKMMAAYGATVLKIEGRGRPDTFRGGMGTMFPQTDFQGPFNPWLNRGAGFGFWNTGKLSVALNVTKPRGKEIAKKFIAWSDIVIENFAGGAMKRMGLGYEDLLEIKPDVIMLSSCMQGQTGPHYAHPGFGTQLVNLAGFSSISGYPDREPSMIGAYTDYIAPHFSLIAIMAALDYRRRTGKGQYIDLSQFESGLHFMSPLLMETAANGTVSERVGNYYPYAAPHGVYPCLPRHTDRACIIAVYDNEEWQRFSEAIGDPEWTRDPKFSTIQARRDNREELDRRVEEWTIQFIPEEVSRRLREAEIWSGEVDSTDERIKNYAKYQNQSPYTAPHGIYRCHPEFRWCAIAVFTDEEWQSFCRVIGNPEWTREPRFSTLQERLKNTDVLDELVAEWTCNRMAEDVMFMMQGAGVPAGILETGEDMMDKDPQFKERHLFWELDHQEAGKYRGMAPSFMLSRFPYEIERSPLMGEHNEYALKEFLGMSDEEIKELIREGVLE